MSPFLVLKLFCFVQAIQNWFKLSPFSHTDLAWNKPPEGLQNVSRFRSSSSFGTRCFSLELAEHTCRRFLSSLHRLPNWKGHLSPPVLVSFPESLYTRPNLETLWLHPQNCGDEGARQVIAFFQMPAISKARLCSAGTWVAPPSTSGSSAHSFFCIKDLPTLSIKLSPIPSLLLVWYELILARNNIGYKNESKFCLATASNPEFVWDQNTSAGVNFSEDTYFYCCPGSEHAPAPESVMAKSSLLSSDHRALTQKYWNAHLLPVMCRCLQLSTS